MPVIGGVRDSLLLAMRVIACVLLSLGIVLYVCMHGYISMYIYIRIYHNLSLYLSLFPFLICYTSNNVHRTGRCHCHVAMILGVAMRSCFSYSLLRFSAVFASVPVSVSL